MNIEIGIGVTNICMLDDKTASVIGFQTQHDVKQPKVVDSLSLFSKLTE